MHEVVFVNKVNVKPAPLFGLLQSYVSQSLDWHVWQNTHGLIVDSTFANKAFLYGHFL